ncbi:MAG: response regulator [Conexibacter sp.]
MGNAPGRPRVLLADHDEQALKLTALRLERAGYEVLVARDGEEALAHARAELPDVCVLDVMTPKLTGYDVTRLLREDPRTSAIAVILLTALGAEGVAAQGFCGGADDYVRKPFSPHELRTRVQAVLARRAAAAANAAAAS